MENSEGPGLHGRSIGLGARVFGKGGVGHMQYQSDYVLRLIEQMGSLVRRALDLLREGDSEETYELAEEAVGLALDMDPTLAARLSPQSLASLVEMNNLDDRVIELVGTALRVQGDVLEREGELVQARVRRDQSKAVLDLLDPSRAN